MVVVPVEVLSAAAFSNVPPPKVEEEPKKRRKIPPPPAAQKKPKPKAIKKKSVVAKPKVEPKAKPKKKAKKTAPPPDSKAELERVLSGILKNVEKVEQPPPRTAQKGATVRNLPNNANKYDAAKPLSLSQIEALQDHFARCWTIPAGAREGAKLQVRIDLKISPRGDIVQARIAPGQDLAAPFFRAAAESALRAVESPNCNKVDLPIEQYPLWKDMTLNFDPSRTLGG